jgi:hypothetical protein
MFRAALVCILAGCAAPLAQPAVVLVGSCDDLEVVARLPAAAPALADLVVAVDGDACERDWVGAGGRPVEVPLAGACDAAGTVEATLAAPGARHPLARARRRCLAEPDD